MVLAFPWMLAVVGGLLILAVGAGVWWGVRRARRAASTARLIARAERVRSLETVAQAVRMRTFAAVGVVVLGTVAVGAAAMIAARPQTAQVVQPVSSSRDIMLCLDVSGSMAQVDVEALEVFADLVDGFEGERIGLTVFNSTSVQIFPLTDDYAFVQTQLAAFGEAMSTPDLLSNPGAWEGTLNGVGSSLVGDGLASCALGFDHADQDRSRSIVLATDNDARGESIVSLPDAAAFARSGGIRVFALNPVDGVDATQSAELSEVARVTGGQAYTLRGTTTVGDIVAAVQEQESAALVGAAQIVWTDTPDVWIAVLLVLVVGFVVLLWRVRL